MPRGLRCNFGPLRSFGKSSVVGDAAEKVVIHASFARDATVAAWRTSDERRIYIGGRRVASRSGDDVFDGQRSTIFAAHRNAGRRAIRQVVTRAVKARRWHESRHYSWHSADSERLPFHSMASLQTPQFRSRRTLMLLRHRPIFVACIHCSNLISLSFSMKSAFQRFAFTRRF